MGTHQADDFLSFNGFFHFEAMKKEIEIKNSDVRAVRFCSAIDDR
jgi:hypothetical protein